jgi:hypothetical protein
MAVLYFVFCANCGLPAFLFCDGDETVQFGLQPMNSLQGCIEKFHWRHRPFPQEWCQFRNGLRDKLFRHRAGSTREKGGGWLDFPQVEGAQRLGILKNYTDKRRSWFDPSIIQLGSCQAGHRLQHVTESCVLGQQSGFGKQHGKTGTAAPDPRSAAGNRR